MSEKKGKKVAQKIRHESGQIIIKKPHEYYTEEDLDLPSAFV